MRSGVDDREYIDIGLVEISKIFAMHNVFFFGLEALDRIESVIQLTLTAGSVLNETMVGNIYYISIYLFTTSNKGNRI